MFGKVCKFCKVDGKVVWWDEGEFCDIDCVCESGDGVTGDVLCE